jgi:hypothetical protein
MLVYGLVALLTLCLYGVALGSWNALVTKVISGPSFVRPTEGDPGGSTGPGCIMPTEGDPGGSTGPGAISPI